MTHITREAWLNAAIDLQRPLFAAAGYEIPANVRVTCGWPSRSALSRKRQRVGECWSDKQSAGSTFELFISPSKAEPVQVLDILAHELVHATVGLKAKHGKLFKRCAVGIGLTGRMTATHAGDALAATLTQHAGTLGAYPHSELRGMTNGDKKQGTRLIKAECTCCGYTVRVTRKWLERDGAPLCPRNSCDEYQKPLEIDQPE